MRNGDDLAFAGDSTWLGPQGRGGAALHPIGSRLHEVATRFYPEYAVLSTGRTIPTTAIPRGDARREPHLRAGHTRSAGRRLAPNRFRGLSRQAGPHSFAGKPDLEVFSGRTGWPTEEVSTCAPGNVNVQRPVQTPGYLDFLSSPSPVSPDHDAGREDSDAGRGCDLLSSRVDMGSTEDQLSD